MIPSIMRTVWTHHYLFPCEQSHVPSLNIVRHCIICFEQGMIDRMIEQVFRKFANCEIILPVKSYYNHMIILDYFVMHCYLLCCNAITTCIQTRFIYVQSYINTWKFWNRTSNWEQFWNSVGQFYILKWICKHKFIFKIIFWMNYQVTNELPCKEWCFGFPSNIYNI